MPSDDVKELDDLIDAVKAKLEEMGADSGTADALLNAVRPGGSTIVGNLADLQRMGAIAVKGEIPTAVGEDDIETTDTQDAFELTDQQKEQQRLNDEEAFGEAVGLDQRVENKGSPGTGQPAKSADAGPVSESMTKQELLDEASNRQVSGVNDSMTKQEIIDAINKG